MDKLVIDSAGMVGYRNVTAEVDRGDDGAHNDRRIPDTIRPKLNQYTKTLRPDQGTGDERNAL